MPLNGNRKHRPYVSYTLEIENDSNESEEDEDESIDSSDSSFVDIDG